MFGTERRYIFTLRSLIQNIIREKPAKLFYDNVNGLEFNVYFTTDGIHKIIPIWSNILLELSFILRTQDL